MKKLCKILSLTCAFCMVLSIACYASAAEYDGSIEDVDVVSSEELTRGASWPTEGWDLINKSYSGRASISDGKGVYASYYFGCNGDGEIKVTMDALSSVPLVTYDRLTFEIYNKDTKKLVDSYNFGNLSYDGTTRSHTFTGLRSDVLYVVRFVDTSNTSVDQVSGFSGNITVSHP